MAQKVRTTIAADKAALSSTLAAAGFRHRIRVIRNGLRAVVEGDFDRQALADTLNAAGFRMAAGMNFSRFSFNGPEAYVRGVAL